MVRRFNFLGVVIAWTPSESYTYAIVLGLSTTAQWIANHKGVLMATCSKCKRFFKSTHALKVHIARAHGPGWSTRPRHLRETPSQGGGGGGLADVPTDVLVKELNRRVAGLDRIRGLVLESVSGPAA